MNRCIQMVIQENAECHCFNTSLPPVSLSAPIPSGHATTYYLTLLRTALLRIAGSTNVPSAHIDLIGTMSMPTGWGVVFDTCPPQVCSFSALTCIIHISKLAQRKNFVLCSSQCLMHRCISDNELSYKCFSVNFVSHPHTLTFIYWNAVFRRFLFFDLLLLVL